MEKHFLQVASWNIILGTPGIFLTNQTNKKGKGVVSGKEQEKWGGGWEETTENDKELKKS